PGAEGRRLRRRQPNGPRSPDPLAAGCGTSGSVWGGNKGAMTTRLLVLVFIVVATALGVVAAGAQQPSDQRVALLIGNANYPDASAPLAAPAKSVRLLAEELRRSGFDVDTRENLGKEEMQRAIDAFKQKIRPGAAALLFFSGYGLQINRQSFIIPVNAQIWSENDIRRDGISVETVLNDLNSRGARVKILIVAASRRNPYDRRLRRPP